MQSSTAHFFLLDYYLVVTDLCASVIALQGRLKIPDLCASVIALQGRLKIPYCLGLHGCPSSKGVLLIPLSCKMREYGNRLRNNTYCEMSFGKQIITLNCAKEHEKGEVGLMMKTDEDLTQIEQR